MTPGCGRHHLKITQLGCEAATLASVARCCQRKQGTAKQIAMATQDIKTKIDDVQKTTTGTIENIKEITTVIN